MAGLINEGTTRVLGRYQHQFLKINYLLFADLPYLAYLVTYNLTSAPLRHTAYTLTPLLTPYAPFTRLR